MTIEADYLSDVQRVAERPDTVALLEAEKGRVYPMTSRPDAIDIALAEAKRLDLHVKLLDGISERGNKTVFYLIGAQLHPMRLFCQLWQLQPSIPRRSFQIAAGRLFGYSEKDIADFLETETARKCKCTCCGRNDTLAAMKARRTQYHAN